MFLNELAVLEDSGQSKVTSVHSEGSGNESPELSRHLRLQDVRTKTCYNMLAPSVKERNLWYKCLEQACSEFLENEKCHLQRQQSSKYAGIIVHKPFILAFKCPLLYLLLSFLELLHFGKVSMKFSLQQNSE
jgi:hypothetical protein